MIVPTEYDRLFEHVRDLSRQLQTVSSYQEILDPVIAFVEETLPAADCYIKTFQSDYGVIEDGVVSTGDLPGCLLTYEQVRDCLAAQGNAGSPLVVSDTNCGCPDITNLLQECYDMQKQQIYLFPLLLDSQLTGVFFLAIPRGQSREDRLLHLFPLLVEYVNLAFRRIMLEQAERHHHHLEAIHHLIAQAISSMQPLSDVMSQLVLRLADIISYDAASILIVEDNTLQLVAGVVFDEPMTDTDLTYDYTTIPVLYDSLTTGQSVHLGRGELANAHTLPAWVEGMQGWIGIPLITADVVVGYIALATCDPTGFTAGHLERAEKFSHQAVLALAQSHLLTHFNETQIHLTRLSRLAMTGEIVSGIAHQINNPLTTVIAQSYLLLKNLDADDPHYQRAEKIRAAAYRAANVVQRMQEFSRSAPQELTDVDINDSVLDACALIQAQIGPGVVDLQLSDDPLPVNASPQRLQDVWINLLLNARDAVAAVPDPRIVITTRFDKQTESITIIIRDNGPGISEQDRTQIFEPFFTTKEHKTGLGLALCQDIVTGIGGTIDIEEDNNEQGACFVVQLPMSSAGTGALSSNRP